MSKKIAEAGAEPGPLWETLEGFASAHVQALIQRAPEVQITDLLGRAWSERRTLAQEPVYRNGYGKPGRPALSSGTITGRRPRVRGLDERFESRILALFRRRTAEVGALLPQLCLHGLALGDSELALRGLLGDATPLSVSSVPRLRAQ